MAKSKLKLFLVDDPNRRQWTTHVHVHQLADALPALEKNVLARRTDRKEA